MSLYIQSASAAMLRNACADGVLSLTPALGISSSSDSASNWRVLKLTGKGLRSVLGWCCGSSLHGNRSLLNYSPTTRKPVADAKTRGGVRFFTTTKPALLLSPLCFRGRRNGHSPNQSRSDQAPRTMGHKLNNRHHPRNDQADLHIRLICRPLCHAAMRSRLPTQLGHGW